MQTKTCRRLWLAGVSALAAATATSAWSQAAIDEVIVTGSRAAPRTAIRSPVPVDSFSQEDIDSISVTDTQDLLKTLVPSYTLTRQPISDGATFIRPASLRGLPSDKTLLLVNSKRRHRSALVVTGGSGVQAQDAAQIPASALKSVEVLRDGAGAQYGSDAIAGVINFILKDSPSGGSLQVQAGQYYEKDGDSIIFNGDIGLPLPNNGFIHGSFEYVTEQPSSRAQTFCNRNIPNQSAGFCIPLFPSETTGPGTAYTAAYAQQVNYAGLYQRIPQKWGQPEAEAFRAFFNAGMELGVGELYAFGNFGRSHMKEDFNYRNPVDVGASTNNLDDYVRMSNGQLFRANQIFPLGFTPEYFGTITDYSLIGGYRGEAGPLGYDLSARYGYDKLRYDLDETVNFSLGEKSPTEFHQGDLISDEWALNADFVYELGGFTPEPIAVAFGAEYRKEGYEIREGDVNAYIAGPYAVQDPYDFCTNETNIALRTLRPTAPQNQGIVCNSATQVIDGRTFTNPVYAVLGVGSNGAPGIGPQYAGRLTRNSKAAYLDVSTDLTDRLFVQGALRVEDFSDFGSTLDYKVAGRFEINDIFAVRGSVGTGFRAPTTGQNFTTIVSTVVNNGQPVAQGLFPATNPVAQFLGAEELEPETSLNFSLGVTATPLPGLSISADAYFIQIDDMFYAVTPITVTPALQAALIAANVPGADTIGQVNFFQNAFDAEVQGVDVVATYAHNWDNGQATNVTASLNYNMPVVKKVKTIVDPSGVTRTFFDGEYVYDFKHYDPRWRSVITAVHTAGLFSAVARASIYGPYKNMFSASNNMIQKWDPEIFIDVEGSWEVTESTKLSLGVRNLFDNYPTRDLIGESATNGRIYRSDMIVDWQGGFYYARIGVTF
ncbi:TonB-dependent siderophore receptor [Phenylobacterium sp. J367]|uniref:TonB-dependent receptor plug domain-containing protein n=1 Tax=Phenylobacterium sp. J367 TaxID=2898435 RepID=UPI0021519B09|nr:TonB-dependent receptor [Phenylobacterium sp. J367]MCR5878713.1 TonB-dependent receptor [Phenylobacterium sp. J367]